MYGYHLLNYRYQKLKYLKNSICSQEILYYLQKQESYSYIMGVESFITQVANPADTPDSTSSLLSDTQNTKITLSASDTVPKDQNAELAVTSPRTSSKTPNAQLRRRIVSWKSNLNSFFTCCFQSTDSTSRNISPEDAEFHKKRMGFHSPTPGAGAGIITQVSQDGGRTTPAIVKSSMEKSEVPPVISLLPPLSPENIGKKCLVLDLDETLVHSSFKPVAQADFIIPVEIDEKFHDVYVLKRPGVDAFFERLNGQFEIVVFTASLDMYADPVMDKLDPLRATQHRLFREHCFFHKGSYVKDLSQLGRDLKSIIILDNSPASYMFHPENAIPITSWFNDPNDTELLDLIPFLEDLKNVDDVRTVLDNSNNDF